MQREKKIVEIDCLEVIRELSNYLENDLSAELREQIVEHLKVCAHCTAIHDGLNNVVRLLANEKAVELPAGLSERLFQRVAQQAR